MAGISAFRSPDARAAYCRLYDEALSASTIPVRESDVETSLGRTHVLTAGDPSKPTLVALHGKSLSSTSWLPLLPVLTARHRVTMIDAIGDVNKSVATKPITKTSQIVTWLDETLTALEIRNSSMLGLSMGTWMATQYAMAFPERVDRLALICPVGIVSGQHPLWLLRAMTTVGVRPRRPRLESFLDSLVSPAARPLLRQDPWAPIMQQFVVGAIGFRSAYVTVFPRRCDLQRLASAPVPVLAIIGRDESLHDAARFTARLRARLPDARVEVVDGANHMIPVDQPETVEKLLAEFLS